jgi:hypothetical protein
MILFDLIITIFSYGISLVLLALIIGFSPILYSLVLGFKGLSPDKRRQLNWWLIIGVITGIICMFLLGGGIALLFRQLLSLVSLDGDYHHQGVLLSGLALMLLAAMRSRRQSIPKKSTKKSSQAILIFLIAFSRTVTSVSGLAAVLVISVGLSSRGITWPITLFLIGPIVLAIATLPLFILANDTLLGSKLSQIIDRYFLALKTKTSSASTYINLILAISGTLFTLYGILGIAF